MSSAERARRNAFVATELDRAGERRTDQAWLDELLAAPQSRFLVVDAAGRVLLDPTRPEPRWLDARERARLLPRAEASLLGLARGHAWFLLRAEAADEAVLAGLAGSRRLGLRALGEQVDAFTGGLCAYACGLAHWQAGMRFCPACGSPLRHLDAGHRAECSNPACARVQFPRTDPAIIVIVEHDDACLLGRQASWPEGRFSTLAGFVEPGEALADAVRREVAEESGVEVLDCDFHSSQPWPFPASLMLGFTATAAGRRLELRDGELQEARWFTPDDIVREVRAGSLRLSAPVSVSWHLLEDWMQRRAGISLRDLAPRG